MTQPTYYAVQDLSGRVLAYVLSDKKDAIRATVIGAVDSWLDEILYVPRNEIQGRPDSGLRIEIRT